MTVGIELNSDPRLGVEPGRGDVLAPIAIFVYRRPTHTRRMIESLKRNKDFERSAVTVYCDGSKGRKDLADVQKTREVVRELLPNARIVEQSQNRGLANSIIAGVSELCKQYGRVIVIEDDLILSPFAIRYFNDALERYANEERVMHVAGYMFPVDRELEPAFFYREATCWGWATWNRAWKHFEPSANVVRDYIDSTGSRSAFDVNDTMYFYAMLERQCAGKLDSWAIRWYGSMFMKNGLALHPARSLIANEGFDGTGIHCNSTDEFNVALTTEAFQTELFPTEVTESMPALSAMMAHRRSKHGQEATVPDSSSKGFALLRDLLGKLEISPVLIDVGCSGIGHSIWEPIIAQSTIVAFDPDERNIPDGLYGTAKRLILVNKAVAVSDDVTSVEFVLTRSPSCSSTLEPDLEALADWSFHDLFVPERRTSAPAVSLNKAIAEHGLPAADWIKVDSQGTDLRIVRSLTPDLLAGVMAVNVEPGLIDAYKGEDLFHDVHRFMTEQQFWLSNIKLQEYERVSPRALSALAALCNFKRADQVKEYLRKSPTAADALYFRTPASLQSSPLNLRSAIMLFSFALLDNQIGAAFNLAERVRQDARYLGTAETMNEIIRLRVGELQASKVADSAVVAKMARRIARGVVRRLKALIRRVVR